MSCNFWLVDYLARLGETARAQALFDRLCGLANDLGLYAEEFEKDSLRPMGNFPQAFSHEGLITAALALEQASRDRQQQERHKSQDQGQEHERDQQKERARWPRK